VSSFLGARWSLYSLARIGENVGLSEDKSYELFGLLGDEGFVDPDRAYRSGGTMPGSISQIVGREENITVIGDDAPLTRRGAPKFSDFTARLRGGGLRKAVVATDSASVDVDYDNGTALHGWTRLRGGSEAADRQLVAVTRPARN
jgi:hypothetical protein